MKKLMMSRIMKNFLLKPKPKSSHGEYLYKLTLKVGKIVTFAEINLVIIVL